MISGERRGARSINVWPGYVDALSSLLMVVIFVILVFTIAQFLLSEILSSQESELTSLHRQVAQLAEMLGLEKKRSEVLTGQITELSDVIGDLIGERDTLRSRMAELSEQSKVDREELGKQLLLMASLQEDIDVLREMRRELERKVGTLAADLGDREAEIGVLRDRSKALDSQLAEEKERTVLAQKEIEQREIRIQALAALVGEQKRALEDERKLSADARAEVALLNQQIGAMRLQLKEIERALKVAEGEKKDQEAKIEDLGKRLNIALAREVNRLERYRSEFFGRLREILKDNPQVQIEGDRFVLQAELLFASGSADLGEEGERQLKEIAAILLPLSRRLPKDLNWILRIDGHTDRIPIHNEYFSSNWELSTARAVSVVKFLAAQGVPPNRMTAAGFGEFHPIDPSNSTEAFRKNRRIEIKLTSR